MSTQHTPRPWLVNAPPDRRQPRKETFIYRCRKCKAAKRVEMVVEKVYEGYGRWGVRYRPAPGIPQGFDQCCGRYMTGNRLQATLKPTVKCNVKCTGAVGFICDCSCGGKNHASGGGMFTQLLESA